MYLIFSLKNCYNVFEQIDKAFMLNYKKEDGCKYEKYRQERAQTWRRAE